ncbi:hypothetical protein CDAR_381 [Caerostris darwini]|uniref:Uncharacterized protein n=1 Tax=Caerostris darwini TaxID=1538125 RepID=A0AAV4UC72_9ARAC|nr:hypothetical protein CDAR_381 [Caerostris darwini]
MTCTAKMVLAPLLDMPPTSDDRTSRRPLTGWMEQKKNTTSFHQFSFLAISPITRTSYSKECLLWSNQSFETNREKLGVVLSVRDK